MCGILGHVGNTKGLSLDNFDLALRRMDTRGPDYEGRLIGKDFVFGHKRLSILDLDKRSNQPMVSECGRFTMVYNGEVYNFKSIRRKLACLGYSFNTSGDTEVVLKGFQEWSDGIFSEINGMFAVAIFDEYTKTLTLARDEAGQKPLFYSLGESSLVFGSTLLSSALIKPDSQKQIDNYELGHYLYRGYTTRGGSLIKGIYKVEPNSIVKYSLNDRKITKSTIPRENISTHSNDLNSTFDKIFTRAVSEQIEADVTSGVLLSGGLDSSLITAVAAKNYSNLKTFTVSFNKGKSSVDESDHAKLISNYFSTQHTEIQGEILNLGMLTEILDSMDEPVIDSSFIPTWLLAKTVKKYTTVVLGGDGADELFGGYGHYRRYMSLEKYKNPIVRNLGSVMKNLNYLDYNTRKWLGILAENNEYTPITTRYWSDAEITEMTGTPFSINREKTNNNSVYEAMLKDDFDNYLSSDILVKTDRSMMAHSVESRCPFLDSEIIAFGKNLSLDEKFNKNSGKLFLQEYARSILPQNFHFGRKQGFLFNIGEFVNQAEVKEFIFEQFSKANILPLKIIESLYIKNHKTKKEGERIFGLLVLSYWKNKLNENIN